MSNFRIDVSCRCSPFRLANDQNTHRKSDLSSQIMSPMKGHIYLILFQSRVADVTERMEKTMERLRENMCSEGSSKVGFALAP